ncbi:MAG: hypothetical protein FWD90_11765 [Defluviitaleaceae bacterium]|nr:hypothetical protein [Defluviitaleaceae bacterium]
MKQRFIPLEKLSKRKQKKVHAAQRKDWGQIKPVTSRIESAKIYNRKKSKHRWGEHEPGLGFFVGVITIILLVLLLLPVTVRATHGIYPVPFVITVEGKEYEIWGYSGDVLIFAFRPRDIAYILSGTSVQFNIRQTPDERWDYWLVPGEAYTPTGDELREMPFRSALFGSYGFVSGEGIYEDPYRLAVIGIGEANGIPAATVPLLVVGDIDGIYFMLESLEGLLGFTFCHQKNWPDLFVETDPGKIVDLPLHTPEFINLLIQLNGHWIDRVYYYGDENGEGVPLPVSMGIFPLGPTGYDDSHAWHLPCKENYNAWYGIEEQALRLRILDCGRPEISNADGSRIVVDANSESIDSLEYHIGDMIHHMVRFSPWRPAFVSHAEETPAEPMQSPPPAGSPPPLQDNPANSRPLTVIITASLLVLFAVMVIVYKKTKNQ